MRTTILLEIDSDKPLPDGATDIVAQRIYQWAGTKSIRCGDVTARILSQVEIDALKNEQPPEIT